MRNRHMPLERISPSVKFSTTVVVLAWVLVVLALASMLGGCNPHVERPSALATLLTTESTITAGAETLADAVSLGTVDVASEDYARAYQALEQINATLDAAWKAYRRNELLKSNAMADMALEAYKDVRPLLYRLAGVAQ